METNQPGQPDPSEPPVQLADEERADRERVGAQQSPTEGPGASSRSRFWVRRDLDDKIVGGVCGGIGRRYNVDPVLLRVLFIVGTLAFLVGPLAYVALWLLLPTTASADPSPLTRSLWRMVFGVFVALGAAGALLGWFGSLGGVMGVIVGGSIVVLGYWLYSRPRAPIPDSNAQSTHHTEPGSGPSSWAGVPIVQAEGETAYNYPSLPPPTPPRPRAPRSYLGLIVLLASLVVAFAMIVVSTAGLVSINAVVIMSVTLAILSAGLIVGAFRGWSRLLIIPALGLALILGAGAQVSDRITNYTDAGVGEQVWEPKSSGTYELGIGTAELDLGPWASDDTITAPVAGDSIAASVGAGELRVTIPSDWSVKIVGEVGIGEIVVEGTPTSDDIRGPVYRGEFVRPDAVGEISLALRVDYGQISIELLPAPGSDAPLPAPSMAAPPVPGQVRPGSQPANPAVGSALPKELSVR